MTYERLWTHPLAAVEPAHLCAKMQFDHHPSSQQRSSAKPCPAAKATTSLRDGGAVA